jgi:hypothetical protein
LLQGDDDIIERIQEQVLCFLRHGRYLLKIGGIETRLPRAALFQHFGGQ